MSTTQSTTTGPLTGDAPPARPWIAHYAPGVPATLSYPDAPLWAFVRDAATARPAHPALHFLGATLTYAALWEQVQRCATALQRLGVRRGDRVALMLPNCPQFAVAFYGALRAGATVVGINPLYTPRELAQVLADSGAETLVVLEPLRAVYDAAATGRAPGEPADAPRPRVRRVVVTALEEWGPGGAGGAAASGASAGAGAAGGPPRTADTAAAAPPPNPSDAPPPTATHGGEATQPFPVPRFRLADLLAAAPARPADVPCEPATDVAMLQYTGGTTGVSKGAMLTHRNVVANCLQTRAWSPGLHDGEEIAIGVLPFFHIYGLTVVLNLTMATGGTVVVLPRFTPEDVLGAIQHYRATLLGGVPTMYVALIAFPQLGAHDLSSLKFANSGAAPMPLPVLHAFEGRTGLRLVEGYGLSEAAPTTHSNPTTGATRPGSVGLPLPDVECEIRDDDGRALPPGAVGEVCVRGPNVMRGYWNRPDETARALRDGADGRGPWLHTGDLGRMDADGFLYIVDRKKDMILVGGYNVYPREVEEVLFTHPAVQEAVVVAAPDAYLGEVPAAFVVPKPGQTIDVDALLAFCKERLVHYKLPRQLHVRDALPRSAVGKLLRRVLRDELAAGRGA